MIASAHMSPLTNITLAPGEFHFGEGNTRITTLLGSCIAITMWHPGLLIGGMCHFLLPSGHGRQRLSRGSYADEAVELFLQAIHKTGGNPLGYEVKVFGGGNMLHSSNKKLSTINVSKSNIDAAFSLLEENKFTVKASDVGGVSYRKICFELWTGDVWVKHGRSSHEE